MPRLFTPRKSELPHKFAGGQTFTPFQSTRAEPLEEDIEPQIAL